MTAVLVALIGVVGTVVVELLRRSSKKAVEASAETAVAAESVRSEQQQVIDLLRLRVAILEEALELCEKRNRRRSRSGRGEE